MGRLSSEMHLEGFGAGFGADGECCLLENSGSSEGASGFSMRSDWEALYGRLLVCNLDLTGVFL